MGKVMENLSVSLNQNFAYVLWSRSREKKDEITARKSSSSTSFFYHHLSSQLLLIKTCQVSGPNKSSIKSSYSLNIIVYYLLFFFSPMSSVCFSCICFPLSEFELEYVTFSGWNFMTLFFFFFIFKSNQWCWIAICDSCKAI